MGPLTWTLAGGAAAALARATPLFRKHFLAELLIAVLASFTAGVAATALDFGGWSELAWPAEIFAFSTAAAAIALFRFVTVRSSAGWPKP